MKKLLCALLFLLLTAPIWSSQSRITDIRYWVSPQYAEVVIDLEPGYKLEPVKQLPQGTRYFDIVGGFFRPRQRTFYLEDGFFKSIQIEQRRGYVRVFLDVTDNHAPTQFNELPKSSSHPDRLIFKTAAANDKASQDWRTALRREGEVARKKQGYVIVLDAGHGGEDPGAQRLGLVEKDLNLALVREIKTLGRNLKNLTILTTRDKDFLIPLEERYQIAEYLNADLFISIHHNTNPDSRIRGTEIYYQSHKGGWRAAQKKFKELLNNPDSFGGIKEGDVPEYQAKQMSQSLSLAEAISGQFDRLDFIQNRGAKRAGFLVLNSLSIPSVLIETGYLTHRQDRAVIQDPDLMKRFAASVLLGAVRFLGQAKNQQGLDEEYLNFFNRHLRLHGADKFHRVKNGETIDSIAKFYGIARNEVLRANEISEDHYLKAGALIRIPLKKGGGGKGGTHGLAGKYLVYKVRSGDSLSRIANRFSLPQGELKRANPGIAWGKLPIGAKLVIPQSASGDEREAAEEGEQIDAAASPKDPLEAEGESNKETPVEKPAKATLKWRLHLVKAGESLDSLARAHHTTVANLRAKNGIKKKKGLLKGTKIWVPII